MFQEEEVELFVAISDRAENFKAVVREFEAVTPYFLDTKHGGELPKAR